MFKLAPSAPPAGGPPPELLAALAQGQGGAPPPPPDNPDVKPIQYSIDKVSPEIARYLAPGSTCGTCEFFDGQGGCKIVSGPIDPAGTCSLWTGGGASPDDAPPDDAPPEEPVAPEGDPNAQGPQ